MIKKLLPKTEFSKNVANVAGGTFISQVITTLLFLVLARLYSKADIGIYFIFINFASTAGIGATLRYELAVMLPQKEEESINVVSLSVIITVLYTLLTYLLLTLFGGWFLHAIDMEVLKDYLPSIALYVLFFGLMSTLNYWLSRVKKFTVLSAGKVLQAATMAILSIGLFYSGFTSDGLIISGILAQVGIGLLYLIFFQRDWMRLKVHVTRQRMREMFKRYLHFFTFNTPHAFLSTGQDFVVGIVIQYYYGLEVAAAYLFSYRMLKMPAGLIASATGQVFFQRASELFPDGKAIQFQIRKVYKQFLLLSIPIFGLLIVAGPFLFHLILGEQWREAGVYSQILAPSLALGFMVAPISALPVIVKKQNYAILFGIADIILRVGSLYLGHYYDSIYIGLGLLSGTNCLLMLYAAYWYYMSPVGRKATGY